MSEQAVENDTLEEAQPMSLVDAAEPQLGKTNTS